MRHGVAAIGGNHVTWFVTGRPASQLSSTHTYLKGALGGDQLTCAQLVGSYKQTRMSLTSHGRLSNLILTVTFVCTYSNVFPQKQGSPFPRLNSPLFNNSNCSHWRASEYLVWKSDWYACTSSPMMQRWCSDRRKRRASQQQVNKPAETANQTKRMRCLTVLHF